MSWPAKSSWLLIDLAVYGIPAKHNSGQAWRPRYKYVKKWPTLTILLFGPNPPSSTAVSSSPLTSSSNRLIFTCHPFLHPPMSSTSPPPADSEPAPTHRCLWQECTQSFGDPEQLYNHLCNEHIGRKSTNNLCLTCKWKDCGTSCAKRGPYYQPSPRYAQSSLVTLSDICSAVHTPLKPHSCEVCYPPCLLMAPPSHSLQICQKSFKRPQDLKKHEKIHTEEHHAQHKHSKAITVVDPVYVSRVRGGEDPKKQLRVPSARSTSHSSSASDGG